MKNITANLSAACLLFLSSNVNAGMMGPACVPGQLTVPCESSAWDLGLDFFYIKDRYSQNFVLIDTVGTTESQRGVVYDSDRDWGFRLQGSYHFRTGNDLTLEWYHWDREFAENYRLGLTGSTITQNSQYDTKWDAVNLELGQVINVGEYKMLRIHGGIQYAKIEFNGRNTPSTPPTPFNNSTTFEGFGPRAGADMSYEINEPVSIYLKTSASLLLGSSHSVTTTFPPMANSSTLQISTDIIVPELELKLGGTYTPTWIQTDLSFDLGYMWVNYFDPLFIVSPSTNVSNVSNVSYDGFYFGAHWMGNV